MILFLTTLPLWISALIIIIPATAITMAGPIIARHYVDLSRLRTNNEVAGFKFATVGVLYAVLLAFVVVVVWQKFDEADNKVAQEASAAATVYLLTAGIDAPHGDAIRRAATDYLRAAIADDWPAMEHEGESRAATTALRDIYREVLKYHSVGTNGGIVVSEMLRQVDRISDERRERVVMADGIEPGIIWVVLFGGAAVTLGFTFFFGTENLRAQVMMTGALSVLIFAVLFTIVAIDYPFAVPVKVGSEALATVLTDFSR